MRENLFFEKWDEFLDKYNLYYRNLDQAYRKIYCTRVLSVFENIEIVGREGFEVTDEIKIILCASIVQLTFGLKKYWLYGYEKIQVYPEVFLSRQSNDYIKGSTYSNKLISISWKDFASDYLQANDGQNIGLSQFSEALVNSVLNGYTYDLHFASYIEIWYGILLKESTQLKKKLKPVSVIFDKSLKIEDQFARCVEYFFERPAQFKMELPESYAHFCLLLNQDTLNLESNYIFEPEKFVKLQFPLPKKIKPTYKFSQWHWSLYIPIFGCIICPLILFYYSYRIVINIEEFLIGIGILSGLLFVLFYKKNKEIALYRTNFIFIVNLLTGIAPTLAIIILSLNFITPYHDALETDHEVTSLNCVYTGKRKVLSYVIPTLSDNFLNNYPKALSFDIDKLPPQMREGALKARYTIASGLFGIIVIKEKSLFHP